jgi:hypothetical protein
MRNRSAGLRREPARVGFGVAHADEIGLSVERQIFDLGADRRI